jgi:hypothetical protein
MCTRACLPNHDLWALHVCFSSSVSGMTCQPCAWHALLMSKHVFGYVWQLTQCVCLLLPLLLGSCRHWWKLHVVSTQLLLNYRCTAQCLCSAYRCF